jgi:hypothetical protein
MGLFSYNTVPELNTKNMENSPSFLSITHTVLSSKRFRSYKILKIDFAADFCFWVEQRLNRTQLNTIMVGNSLSSPMVHNTSPNG